MLFISPEKARWKKHYADMPAGAIVGDLLHLRNQQMDRPSRETALRIAVANRQLVKAIRRLKPIPSITQRPLHAIIALLMMPLLGVPSVFRL